MNDSVFDPNTFLDTTVDTPFDTVRTTVPAGDTYLATIDDVKGRQVETKQGDRRILDVFWEIQSEELRAQLNLPKVVVRQSVFLDFTVDGKLGHGINQNIQLGQVREAVNQNGPGAWSFRLLIGAGPARLKVSERVDDKNPSIKYNDVDRVSRV